MAWLNKKFVESDSVNISMCFGVIHFPVLDDSPDFTSLNSRLSVSLFLQAKLDERLAIHVIIIVTTELIESSNVSSEF